MLEVQVVSPVEQIDEDEGQREGNAGIVINVVRILNTTAANELCCPLEERQGFATAALHLILILRSGWTSLGVMRFAGDGPDRAVHIVITVQHTMSTLL